MGIAVLTLSSLFAPLHASLARLVLRLKSHFAITGRANFHCLTGANGVFLSKNLPPKPVRVIRLSEAGCPPDVAGRMVISGRMADVCAELDRLEQRAARNIRA